MCSKNRIYSSTWISPYICLRTMRLQKLPIVPQVVQLRLPTPTFSVWNSLPIFDWTGLEPVTHLPLQSVFPLTPSANIISVFIHLTIIYMVTDMKIIIYFIKVWFCCSLFYIPVHIPTSSNVITSFNHQKLLFF